MDSGNHRLNLAFWEVKMALLRYHTLTFFLANLVFLCRLGWSHRAFPRFFYQACGTLPHTLSPPGIAYVREKPSESCDTLFICIRLNLSSLFLACNCNRIFESLRGHEDDFTAFLISAPPYDLSLPSPRRLQHPSWPHELMSKWHLEIMNAADHREEAENRDTEIAKRKLRDG